MEDLNIENIYREITEASNYYNNVEVKIIDMEFMVRYVFSISKAKPVYYEENQTSPEIN